jgi:hemerythrin
MSLEKKMTMRLIIWDDYKFSVGHDILNEQHKKIVEMINLLISQKKIDIHSEVLHDTLQEMLKYSQEHLDYEEELLKQLGYDDFEHHTHYHLSYLEQVSLLSMSTVEGKKQTPEELITFLKHWWEIHILIEDMKYKKLMLKQQK